MGTESTARRIARNAITAARWHLEAALYKIRLSRLREKRTRAYAGEIPMDDYLADYLEFWHRYEERGE